MNIFKNLIQGSEAWLKIRASHFTASETAAMLGVSRYMSRTELLNLKKSGIAKPVNPTTQKLFDQGHAAEELARPIAEKLISEDLYPVTASIEFNGVNLLASFDGLTLLNDIVWENKLLNESLRENLIQGIIPDQYKPQLQQQLMVSGAKKAMFMASDGTEENTFYAWYESDIELADKIVSGWAQFAKDLAVHEVKAKAEKLVGTDIAELPKLEVSLVGNVSNSNLVEYKGTALSFIQSINTELTADQDFVDAEKAVKWCQKGEKELEAVKEKALSDTADIKILFDTIDELKEEMRQKRLTLSKLVKSRKEEIRKEISMSAQIEFSELLIATSKNLTGIQITQVTANFDHVMKGKKTVESLQNAVDTELARVKIELSEISELVRSNLNSLTELAADFKFLFNDFAHLVFKANEDLVNLIKSRISEHKEAEKLKLEQQREQIRLEEERKAKAKVEAEEKRKAQIIENDRLLKEQEAIKQLRIEQEKLTADQNTERALSEAIATHETPTSVDKEVVPTPTNEPSLRDISVFLQTLSQRSLSDFGYLLLSNDEQHEQEALGKIKAVFNVFYAAKAA